MSGSLIDYGVPRAGDVPFFVTNSIEIPTSTYPLGAKGAGEAGCVAPPPRSSMPCYDALKPLGVELSTCR